YNNYYGIGTGNGFNYVAILDPNATEVDPISGQVTMAEVMKIEGPTPDPSGGPNSVHEWCINSAAVDPATDSILVNSEDGKLYRWYLGAGGSTGEFTEVVTLTDGLGEAYTPTVVGADGTVFAIQDSALFAVPEPGSLSILAGGVILLLARRNRNGSRS
ncbi:MAG TPA: PEP-CTERM sorting domain-containing protein, partial [Humisphaera sp.]|nr:PEP-CTERM sorting domain-containing protein [Humisphaera sp.]